MKYHDIVQADARLVILRALADQVDGRWNEAMLSVSLETFGHRWSREQVRETMRFLERLGGIVITEAGTVLIAEITRKGLDHVERRLVIEGVARPSPDY